MSKRPVILLLATIMFSLTALAPGSGRPSHADDQTVRVLSLPDLGSVEYPLDTYSARADLSGLQNDATSDILFPGAFTIAPNDAFVYQQLALGNAVFTVRIASVLPSIGVKAEALPTLFGALPLMAYEQDALNGVEIQRLTIDGLPAVRVNNVVNGAEKIAAHMLVLNGAMVVEIVVLPAKLTGVPMHNAFMTGNEDANREIYEEIIASLKVAR